LDQCRFPALPVAVTPPWGVLPAFLLAAAGCRDYADFRIAIGGAALCPIHVDN
jgi:hypothetical protein